VDRLVAWRADPDALALAEEVEDQPRTSPGLAGARRPLDEQMRVAQPRDEPLKLVEIVRVHGVAPEWPIAAQDPA
jgi:hypothetical protein